MKKIVKNNLIYTITFFLFIILIILNLLNIKQFTFLILSIIANLILIKIYKEVIRITKIKFTKKQLLAIMTITVFIYIFYKTSLLTRKFIYYWDYSCYYNIQLKSLETFNTNLFEGIKYFIGSTWSGEYGNFLSFFPEIIFNFTNKNPNNYILSCVLVFIPYLILSFSILLKVIINKLKIKKENIFLIISLLIFILFPLVHGTFILGQPDIFGLAFIFLIISLTINYNFTKLDMPRLIMIFLVNFMLIISRRWYLYWIITYYPVYIIKIICNNKKNWKQIIKNVLLYGIIVSIIILVTLFPLIKNILFSNYSQNYSYYLSGGFPKELINQSNHLGYLLLFEIFIGIILGLINKKLRSTTILNIIQYILIIFLFTKIQNMGLHHSLTLVPIYIYFLNVIIYSCLSKKTKLKSIFIFIVILISCFVFYNSSIGKVNNRLFSDVNLKVPDDNNYDNLKNVANWLRKNLNKDNTAYMITHNNMFNPDKLRNIYMPDTIISNYLPYGSSIIGVHKFPIELFTAKYIITTSPFDKTSIEYKYNDVFNKLVKQNIFKKIKTYKMKKYYKMYIYERIEKVSKQELNLYKDSLREESKNYPYLYENEISGYLIK